jgi:hypothetical protein
MQTNKSDNLRGCALCGEPFREVGGAAMNRYVLFLMVGAFWLAAWLLFYLAVIRGWLSSSMVTRTLVACIFQLSLLVAMENSALVLHGLPRATGATFKPGDLLACRMGITHAVDLTKPLAKEERHSHFTIREARGKPPVWWHGKLRFREMHR